MSVAPEAEHATPLVVHLYSTGPQCSLCVSARGHLDELALCYHLRIEAVAVDPARIGPRRLAWRVPVVEVEGVEIAEGRIDPANLEKALVECGARTRERT